MSPLLPCRRAALGSAGSKNQFRQHRTPAHAAQDNAMAPRRLSDCIPGLPPGMAPAREKLQQAKSKLHCAFLIRLGNSYPQTDRPHWQNSAPNCNCKIALCNLQKFVNAKLAPLAVSAGGQWVGGALPMESGHCISIAIPCGPLVLHRKKPYTQIAAHSGHLKAPPSTIGS